MLFFQYKIFFYNIYPFLPTNFFVKSGDHTHECVVPDKNLTLPTGASVPVLGLSNKAVFQNEIEQTPVEKHVKDQYDDNSYFTAQHLSGKGFVSYW